MPDEDKVRENRLRRIAERRGYSLEKSRRRDPKAPDFGRFRLIEVASGRPVLGEKPHPFSASVEEIEEWLGERPDEGAIEAEKIAAFERMMGEIEDALRLSRSSESEPWNTRLERIRARLHQK